MDIKRGCGGNWGIVRTLAQGLTFIVFSFPASAHLQHGEWSKLPPEIKRWFQDQRIPNNPAFSCCNEADADEVEEDIRGGQYFIRSDMTGGQWVQVPDEAIIRTPNKFGRPVAWW